MRTVTVKRDDLLERITKNRDAHRELFLKAQEGYRRAIIEELDRMLAEAKSGKKVGRNINLPEPQDHTGDYDRVIDMLTMSIDEEVELDAMSFDQYVRDRWDWKAFADTTNIRYASSVAGAP